MIKALFSNERIIDLIRDYLVDPYMIDDDDFADTNYGINAAFMFAAINGYCDVLMAIISNERILNLIDEFSANYSLAVATSKGFNKIIQILLRDEMKHLINQEGINEA